MVRGSHDAQDLERADQAVASGATYADLGTPESAAKAAVTAAVAAGQTPAQVATLQATADGITGQRNTLFKGETLRGLLLSAYAWSTVGTIEATAVPVTGPTP